MIWQLAVFLATSVRRSSVHELFPPDFFPIDNSFDGRSGATHFDLMGSDAGARHLKVNSRRGSVAKFLISVALPGASSETHIFR